MNKEKIKSLAFLTGSMVIFGTIGLFRRFIDMPSSVLAMARGFIGTIFLLVVLIILKQLRANRNIKESNSALSGTNREIAPSKGKFLSNLLDTKAISTNLVKLLVSGAMIGLNWILLFEAYRYTTVSIATLCYYMSPIFVVLLSPIFLKCRYTLKKIICTICALFGMVLVSGVISGNSLSGTAFIGILFGLGAAILYASVVIINQKISAIGAFDKTIIQLLTAAVITIPYILLTGDYKDVSLTPISILLVIFVGLVHTGVAYMLFFKSMDNLEAQTVALFGYIDPVIALILSALILKEHMGLAEIIGAILILGSAIFSETE